MSDKEYEQMQARAERAEAMVERLIEVGSRLTALNRGHVWWDPEDVKKAKNWDAVVDDWRANKLGG